MEIGNKERIKSFKDYLQKNGLHGNYQFEISNGIGFFKGSFTLGKRKKYFNIIMTEEPIVQSIYVIADFKDYIRIEELLEVANSLNIKNRGARYFVDEKENLCVLYEDICVDREFSPKNFIKNSTEKFKEAIKSLDEMESTIKEYHEKKLKLQDITLN